MKTFALNRSVLLVTAAAVLAGCGGLPVTPGSVSERGAPNAAAPLSWKETSLQSFDFTNGAYNTYAGLVADAAGNLYGTTQLGGTTMCDYVAGCGVVFELKRVANGKWTEKVLHSFAQCDAIGFWPRSGLTLDAKGNLYGTTDWGGQQCDGVAPGTAFELLSSNKGRQWTPKVLHAFEGGTGDGASPQGALTFDRAGNLYGTTSEGGRSDNGTIFELSPQTNGTWERRILHTFTQRDGYGPHDKLAIDTAGDLYGTTDFGGTDRSGCGGYGCGTAFELKPNSSGLWSLSILHSFGKGLDGAYPASGLTLDSAGNLFGTTSQGGLHSSLVPPHACFRYGCGTVYEFARGKNGKRTERILYDFGGGTSGNLPEGDLIIDDSGALYGTTVEGGRYGDGVAFRLTPGSGGKWEEQVLHDFGNDGDGVHPYAGLIFDKAGNLYGTTDTGGNYNTSLCRKSNGCGTIFEISP